MRNREKTEDMKDNSFEKYFTCISSCYECERRIEVDFYDDHFETKEDVADSRLRRSSKT